MTDFLDFILVFLMRMGQEHSEKGPDRIWQEQTHSELVMIFFGAENAHLILQLDQLLLQRHLAHPDPG